MWIKKVYATAFGPFHEQSIELAPGLNVLYGPNEAGKSSWHAAIFAGLCGMSRARGRRSTQDQAFVDRHHPWEADEWSVSVTVELADGETLEIFQDLQESCNSRVTNPITGKDLTDKLVQEGSPDGATLMGLTRRTLPSTLVVRQAQILQVRDDPGGLQEQLQRAAATSGADETAEGAIEQIRKFHAQHVGTERAKTKPLQMARAKLQRKTRELEDAQQLHEAYVRLFEEYLHAKTAAQDAEQEQQRLEQKVNYSRLESLQSRVNRARELTENLPDDSHEDPVALRATRDAIRETLQRFEDRPSEPVLPEGSSAAELEAEIAVLPEEPEGDQEMSEQVIAVERKWRDAISRLEEYEAQSPEAVVRPESGDLGPRDLKQLADILDAPIPEVNPELKSELARLTSARSAGRRLPMGAIVIGVVLSILGVVLLVNASQLLGSLAIGLGILLVVAGLVRLSSTGYELREISIVESRLAVQRDRREQVVQDRLDAETRLKKAGLTTEVGSVRSLADAIEDAEAASRASARWRDRRDELNRSVLVSAGQIRTLLKPRLEDPSGVEEADVEQLLGQYDMECEERRVQADNAERRKQLQATLTSRRAAEEMAVADMEARQSVENEVQELANDTGITSDSIESVVDQLRARLRDLEQEIVDAEQTKRDLATLEGILRGESLESLELEMRRLKTKVGEYEEQETERKGISTLENELAEVTGKLRKAREERDRLLGKVESFPVLDVPEMEEAVETVDAELLHLQTLDSTLSATLAFLEKAKETVQRDIAPRLKASIERRLALVTEGRYKEASVDPETLEVKVRPESGIFRRADLLSQGTTEQVYLLLRVALAEHMASNDEIAPIFLDDATVQSDSTRTSAILDVLHRISEERQIVVFSQEEEVLAWAKENLNSDNDTLVELGVGGYD